MSVPADERFLQGKKSPSTEGEAEAQASIAQGFVKRLMQPGITYILGPGTTTQAVAAALGLEKSLLSISALKDGRWLMKDATEAQLIEIVQQGSTKIVVTPVGGQGFLFGRGNQPISPAVIRAVGRPNIIVLCASGKLAGLRGRALRLDTGDAELDAQLSGPIRILTGYSDQVIYPVGNADEH
jgi:predicted polyphosphate/ATP-dependent NAD kinase